MFLEPSWGQDWLSWSPGAHQPHANEKQTERMSMCLLGLWHRDKHTLHSYFTIGSTGCCVVTTPVTYIGLLNSPSWTLKTLFILCSDLRSFKSENWGSICSSGNKMTWAPHLTSRRHGVLLCASSSDWIQWAVTSKTKGRFILQAFLSRKVLLWEADVCMTAAWKPCFCDHMTDSSLSTACWTNSSSTGFRINSTRYWGRRTGSQSWSNIKSSASFHREKG